MPITMQKFADEIFVRFSFSNGSEQSQILFFLGIYILFFILYNIFVFYIGAGTREQ